MSFIKSILFLFLVSSLLGCSDSSSSGNSSNSEINIPPISTTPTILEGDWESNCFEYGSGLLARTLAKVRGNTTEVTLRVYEVINCRNIKQTQTVVTRFSIGDMITTADGFKAYQYDDTGVSIQWTPNSAVLADVWNQSQYCGYTDWEFNQAKDITSKNCTNFKAGQTYYDIMRVDGDVLYFGDEISVDESSRPRQLDWFLFWRKVNPSERKFPIQNR